MTQAHFDWELRRFARLLGVPGVDRSNASAADSISWQQHGNYPVVILGAMSRNLLNG